MKLKSTGGMTYSNSKEIYVKFRVFFSPLEEYKNKIMTPQGEIVFRIGFELVRMNRNISALSSDFLKRIENY